MTKSFSQTKLALGGDITLTIVCDVTNDTVNNLFNNLWQAIFQFERRFSRFVPMSELSIFNRSAGIKSQISNEFRDILQSSNTMSQKTNGLFNPFVLPALQRAGYTKSFVEDYQNDNHDDYSAKQVVPYDNLEIGDNWATIPYGTAIDLGGCGKGYLADLLADTKVPDWVQGFWFSIGGDIVGSGVDENNESWKVSISSATDPNLDSPWYITAPKKRFAVATSGTIIRGGTKDGKNWHHIINPHTGKPATSDTILATVYTEKAIEADVLASCAIILGSKKSISFLKDNRVLATLLQTKNDLGEDRQISFGRSIHLNKSLPNKLVVNYA